MNKLLDDNSFDNLKLLKTTLNNNKDVLVFVGAGASTFLDIKSWYDILDDMTTEFGSTIDLKKNISCYGYAKTASMIFKDSGDTQKYYSFLSKQFESKKGAHYSLHIKILSLFDIILTTNYDTSFEEAFKDLNYYLVKCGHKEIDYAIQKLPNFNSSDIHLKPTIAYLHGNNDDKTYIFREEEYKEFYRTNFSQTSSPSRLETFLRIIIENFNILFVGFSFNDKIFVEFFQKTLNELKNEKKRFKALYGKDDDYQLPLNFVLYSNEKLKKGISKKKIEEIFGKKDITWKELFTNPDDEELIFKPKFESIMDKLGIGNIVKDKIIEIYGKYNENIEIQRHLNNLNLNVIGFDDYNDIELILRDLMDKDSMIIENTGDAAYAK